MNKDRLKKLLYDLELEYKDIEESLKFIQVYSDNELLKKELSNSLKYKYLSMFILYEDFISMLLKEYNIYKIGITIDSAIKLLKDIDITYRHDVESIIYAFANKFLSGKDLERVKEELKVTELGKSLIDEGKKEKAIEIAKKAILKGMDNETIQDLTDLSIEDIELIRKVMN